MSSEQVDGATATATATATAMATAMATAAATAYSMWLDAKRVDHMRTSMQLQHACFSVVHLSSRTPALHRLTHEASFDSMQQQATLHHRAVVHVHVYVHVRTTEPHVHAVCRSLS